MRKPQIQPSLASLTETDREQLADWLRHAEYKDVLERVNNPRPDGLSLTLRSEKPLRTFYAKIALFDLINSRLSADKKFTLAEFENLSSTTFNFESLTCNRVADVHESILEATHNLATSGDNTAHQLLALQRLADFPERAALRAQREERQCEVHTWKREMHLHKIEMDQFRKQITTERLDLQKRRLQLAEQKLAHGLAKSENTSAKPQEDELGPLARTRADISERARRHFNVPKEEWDRRLARNRELYAKQYGRPPVGDDMRNLHSVSTAPCSADNLSAPTDTSPLNAFVPLCANP